MQPQANACIPGNGYSPSPMPVSYNYQQPVFSQFESHQLVPQAAHPYPPNPGVLPQVPWTYGKLKDSMLASFLLLALHLCKGIHK